MRTILVIIVGLLIVLAFCLAVENFRLKQTVYIPSVTELQQIVGCEKVDGWVSPDWRNSETQEKWDEWYCETSGRVQANKETMK